MQLRPYQSAAVQSIYDYFEQGKGNAPLVVAPTGSGKSLLVASFMQRAIGDYPGTRILLATHQRELIEQDFMTLLRLWPEAPAGIYSAGLGQRKARAQLLFAGVQSVHRKAREIGHVDLMLVDECFPAGTMISTPDGDMRIEDISSGNHVLNAQGSGIVEATRSSSSLDIWKVELSNGNSIRCTGNHPFFTECGWVKASQLEVGRRLFGVEDVRELWRSFPPMDQAGRKRGRDFRNEARVLGDAALLWEIVREASGKSDAQARSSRQDGEYAQGHRASTEGEVRERERIDCAAGGPSRMARSGLGCGTLHHNRSEEGEWEAYWCEGGPCEQSNDGRDRSGWENPYRNSLGRGQGKRQSSDCIRVVSLSREERGCPEVVYNLQVSGHPSYYAGGVLVHNCHLVPSGGEGQYRNLIAGLLDINPYMKLVGFTATPYRLTSGRLDSGEGRIFDGICYDIPVSMLVQEGYLAPLVSKRPGQVFDLSGLHKRMGDYVESELSARFDDDDVTREAVAEIVAAGQDRRSWIAFCISVDHAMHVRDEIRRHGLTAEAVTGSTPSGERDRILSDFKAGRIRALTNVNVLTTGFDAPQTDLLAFLRPTASLGLYMQMAGRGMRIAPGKVDCLVLDFAGNVAKHGPVDAVTPPDDKKKGQGGEAPTKICPECSEIVFAGCRECTACGFVFPEPAPALASTAGTEAIMNLTAQEDWREVRDFALARHVNFEGQVSLRAEYLIGGKVIKEWVCLEHKGFPRQKAVQWWLNNAGTSCPNTVDEALERQGEVRRPTEAVIQREGKYDRIVRTRRMERVAA